MRPRPTGLLLAGGRGQRMGGVDKGLQHYQGQPLALQVLARLRPQVDRVLVSANRHQDVYAEWCDTVLADRLADYPGPLAGIDAALCGLGADEWLLTAACDLPELPLDLGDRLAAGLAGRPAAIARSGGRLHPTCALLHASLGPGLAAYLADGGRRVQAWLLEQCHAAVVDFDDAAAFRNVNTLEDLNGPA
ncbi:molybdenum cofactor guanylyltransferase MobA [Roseateles sp. DJS-2-20]|uniref:Molybdenum cofactor guanylyltransferase n=2 Tax=Roseateles paludis TaxID=3145238 RepID=A0ABV0G1D2_9BURK